MRTGLRVTRGALSLPAHMARQAAELPGALLRAAGTARPGERQVWAGPGAAMAEVRGLDRDDVDRVAAASAVEQRVAATDGVTWARVDPASHRIAVRYDRSRVRLDDVVAALTAAEKLALAALGEADVESDEESEDEADEEPVAGSAALTGGVDDTLDGLLRDDDTAEYVHGTAVVADVLGLAAAVTVRLGRLPHMPSSLAAAVAAVEHQPWLRRRLEARLGPSRTEALIALGNAAVHGMTGNVPALALDAAQRTQTLWARDARRTGLAARAGELGPASRPAGPSATARDERPAPLPDGPVERLVRRMAPTALAGSAALLAATGNPDLAGRALLVGVPRAAHSARSGFVDALGIGLARRGVVVPAPAALRRLDRATTVVVQSDVLHNHRRLVLEARPTADGWSTARVWRGAQVVLDAERDGRSSGPRALVPADDSAAPESGVRPRRLVLVEDGRPVGEVLIGRELDPFADAVVSAVREAGLRLVLTEDGAAPEFGSRADEVLRDRSADPRWLRSEVRRLQAGGEVVVLVGDDAEALDAADVGVGIVPEAGCVPWAADVVCGPGLTEVPRLVAAAPVARATSERGVRVAISATFIGSLLLAVGRPGSGGRAQLPVTMAAAGALLSGTRAAAVVLRRPDPQPVLHTPWHALEAAEVLGRLPDPGLPAPVPDDVESRSSTAARAWRLLRELVTNVRAELNDPLTPVLATGAAASAVIGSPTDAVLVGGVLLGSAVISGAQRMRASRALEELLMDQRLPARLAEVGDPRDRATGGSDRLRQVPAAALRPGHLVALEAGDVVPADARLVAVDDLELDEATLTGESTPVTKEVAATPGAELPDRTGMVYEGTTVLAGSGRAVVVAVGPATEAGRALTLAGRAAAPAGMQHRLEELTRRGLPVTLIGGAAVTGMALLRGRPLRSAVASGVSVAVAAVPEGLPLMATVAQLGAARRLSKRGVLVRASRTVEALGRVDTVCFDKTGTLTEGRLRLVRIAGLDAEWGPADPSARRVLRAAGRAVPSVNGDRPLPHATDQAVLDAAQAVLGNDLDQEWQELAEVPFHSDRGFSAAVGRTAETTRLVIKGAPEVVLPRCSHVRDGGGKHALDQAGRDRAAAAVHALAEQGLRVLAVARRNVGDVAAALCGADDIAELGDLTLLGFLGLADTPRQGAAGTVAVLHRVGVRTVIITGDHPVTARAIAEGLGIRVDDLVTGPELAALEERARVARVAGASVFARVSPEQKLQIVEALRQSGRIVAMVGDGANDAAAIRLADVGIGMSAKGSTSARTAADLVFTEPDVSLVLDALVEGRAMWRRVRDAVAVLLGGNLGEVAFTLAGTALAGHAPIGTRQFLVVNMFTDLLPSMALALAPTPADPRDRTALLAAGPPSLGAPLLRDIAFRGAVTSAGALAAWQIGRVTGTRRRASTIALAALVGTELGQTLLLGGRNPLVIATSLGSAAVLAGVIQIPVVSQFFGCTPLDPLAWATVLASSAGATAASVAVPWLVPRLRAARWPREERSGGGRTITVTGNVAVESDRSTAGRMPAPWAGRGTGHPVITPIG